MYLAVLFITSNFKTIFEECFVGSDLAITFFLQAFDLMEFYVIVKYFRMACDFCAQEQPPYKLATFI